MIKNEKLQLFGGIAIFVLAVIACIIGAIYLAEAISLLVMQESMASDISLLTRIVSFYNYYDLTHILFILISVVMIAISSYVFYKDRTYRFALFVAVSAMITIILVITNSQCVTLMKQAKSLMGNIPIEEVFNQGKDYISVTATLSSSPVPTVSAVALKALFKDIIVLLVFLLQAVVLFVKMTNFQKSKQA